MVSHEQKNNEPALNTVKSCSLDYAPQFTTTGPTKSVHQQGENKLCWRIKRKVHLLKRAADASVKDKYINLPCLPPKVCLNRQRYRPSFALKISRGEDFVSCHDSKSPRLVLRATYTIQTKSTSSKCHPHGCLRNRCLRKILTPLQNIQNISGISCISRHVYLQLLCKASRVGKARLLTEAWLPSEP